MSMTGLSPQQLAVIAIAQELAKLIVMQQWANRGEAKRIEVQINALREQQLALETAIEMNAE